MFLEELVDGGSERGCFPFRRKLQMNEIGFWYMSWLFVFGDSSIPYNIFKVGGSWMNPRSIWKDVPGRKASCVDSLLRLILQSLAMS
jgi:hypothetical protein